LVTDLLGPDPSVGELGQTIADRAAGNPFFAEEIVRELAERGELLGEIGAYISTAEVAEVSVPATLQATIAARIDRLPPEAKRTLSAAAVIGSRFGLELLTELGVEPVDAELVAAQSIDQVKFTRQPEYVFHHPLIHAVAYEAQLKSDRTEMHRRLAAAIEERDHHSGGENAALIAEHLEAAGDLRSAYASHMRAGAWSSNRDIRAARISWERARRVADALPANDPERTAMRIAPRTGLCSSILRVLWDYVRELAAAVVGIEHDRSGFSARGWGEYFKPMFENMALYVTDKDLSLDRSDDEAAEIVRNNIIALPADAPVTDGPMLITRLGP